jgi:hypothetical protein
MEDPPKQSKTYMKFILAISPGDRDHFRAVLAARGQVMRIMPYVTLGLTPDHAAPSQYRWLFRYNQSHIVLTHSVKDVPFKIRDRL